jgi:retron-type reverse transcriptase
MQPLNIKSINNKIVQQAIYLILCELFNPILLSCSHGFKKKRDCHSALKHVFYRLKQPH